MFGVEPICRVLSQHGATIAPSTYYDARKRPPSRRALRDTEIEALIDEARQQRFVARYGARKMWLHLRRQGHDVARCTIERLMARNGWQGALRGELTLSRDSDGGWTANGEPRPELVGCLDVDFESSAVTNTLPFSRTYSNELKLVVMPSSWFMAMT